MPAISIPQLSRRLTRSTSMGWIATRIVAVSAFFALRRPWHDCPQPPCPGDKGQERRAPEKDRETGDAG
jgi:hypothetical protein